ncbi:hypothetical protein P7D95_14395 [Enterococcus avium]|uniref:hypothetical protein n=1 Tax=Enterococcus avium TaxID=33945 RepID=UPI0028924E66|nr:hypothetical protein [Enterococcus avium]MDT2501994.1 hypothetical protein [Enterococcus avium]
MKLLKYLDAEADKLHEENFSSRDEFRTVNHSFVEGFNYALAIVQGFKIELNSNQQVVLEWLEAYADKDSGDWPMQTIFYMWDCIRSDRLGGEELSALRKLTRIEQFEVLTAFAEWGIGNE